MRKMLASAQSPVLSGHHKIQQHQSGRKPLQPKIIDSPAATTPNSTANIKPNPDHAQRQQIEIVLPIDDDNDNNNNKENIPQNYYSTPVNNNNINNVVKKDESSFWIIIESLQDASLGDELSAIREKLDRLRVDKGKTEKMLKERVVMLELKMKEILHRGEVQKQLEIEVDRLYRLNEIRLSCLV